MEVKIIDLLIKDLKAIGKSPGLLIISIFPSFLIPITLFGFTLISEYFLQESGYDLGIYYTLFAMTLASSIPLFSALAFAFIPGPQEGKSYSESNTNGEPVTRELIFSRIISSSILSLLMVLCFIIFTVPVPSEGWLRSLFIVFLLSFQAGFIYLFISCFSFSKTRRIAGLIICALFVIAVPLGLVLFHPWNYLSFFSPLYWIAWSWVIEQPIESLLYSSISFFITAGLMLLCRHLYKRLAV